MPAVAHFRACSRSPVRPTPDGACRPPTVVLQLRDSCPSLCLGSRTGHLGRMALPVDHDGSKECDDCLTLLVVACCFHPHDADAWSRARLALLYDLASGVDRVPLEDRS